MYYLLLYYYSYYELLYILYYIFKLFQTKCYVCALQEQRALVTTNPDPLSAAGAAAAAAGAEASTSTAKRKRSLGGGFKSKDAPVQSSMVQLEDTIKAELDNYLITPTIDGEQDPLTWWRLHHVNFPWLSKLARKYLCIPAKSSP